MSRIETIDSTLRLMMILLMLSGGAIKGSAQTGTYKQNSKKYKAKFADQIPKDEKIVRTWYHYVLTKRAKEDYLLRVFYPQTKQLIAEESYSRKSLKNKEGKAEYWFDNGEKRAVGYYDDGKKIGVWKHYGMATGILESEGEYLNDVKSAVWNSYDHKGRLVAKHNYKNDLKNGAFTQFDSTQTIINEGVYMNDSLISEFNSYTLKRKIEKKAERYPYLKQCEGVTDYEERKKCSDDALIRYLYTTLKFPRDARKYDIGGRSYTQFFVNKDGSIVEIKVVLGFCNQIKESLIEVVSNLPEWKAGTKLGEPVKVLYTLPINFTLE